MLSVTVLGSGSKGNAILVEGSEGAVLIDQGFGPRAITRRLKWAGRRPDEIGALLLTHEHTDHANGATDASRRWGWPVFASAGTLSALTTSPIGCPMHATVLSPGAETVVHGFDVQITLVPHDARGCTAFVLTDRRSGYRIGIALDLGRVPPSLTAAFTLLDLLVVESNHDEQMLANGPYPWELKRRISGALGHLSNGAAAAFASGCVHRGLRGVLLAHLSETNNTPRHALTRTGAALRRAGWRRDALWAAHQVTGCGPHGATDGVAAGHVAQLQFAL